MQMFNESDILDESFRSKVIEEIEGAENTERKLEQRKRWEIYKDRVKHYVINELLSELDQETVNEMQSRASSINIFKKVVSKKARVYQTAPIRTLTNGGDQDEEAFLNLQDLLELNTSMKKSNRYLEAFLNCAVYVRPYKVFNETNDDGKHKWEYEIKILPPHQYDVIEDSEKPENARAFILSSFSPSTTYSSEEPVDREKSPSNTSFRAGDNKQQKIADSEADKDQPEKEYVFWTTNFHFTTDNKGQIIDEKSPDDRQNPINKLPFVPLARDRDGYFWAVGGEDLTDGTIVTNMLVTDYHFIQKIQGMGLFYLFGKDVPKQQKVGPNRAITMNVEADDPTPQIGFASSSPPLSDHRASIEQYVAMLLTTNDLGTNSVSSKLDANDPASGIKDLIEHSEPLNAIEEDQELYRKEEPKVMDIARSWHEYYREKGLLTKRFERIGELREIDYSMRFPKPEQFTTEEKKRENQKARKDLGLVDRVALLMEEEPDLTEDEAIDRIIKMEERKLRIQSLRMVQNGAESQQETETESEGDPNEEEISG